MFLLMAVSEVFLLLGWVWQSDCLCSPTIFYQNCWIRWFPGLAVDLEQSQRRGAHLLKIYAEVTAQQCSRTCCLMKNVSCNLAVFDYETNNCLHVNCPALESCILRHRINVVLYNITPGIDPDLLVFDKLSFNDLNVRSSFNKWERHGTARISDSEKCQDATSSPRCVPSETSPETMAQDLITSSSSPSTTSGSIDRTSLVAPLGPTSASLMVLSTHVTDILSEKKSSTARSESTITSPTSLPPSSTMLSHMPSPAHLNSSKQHLNDTKGYSGRNHTSEDGAPRPILKGVEKGGWLLPVVFGSSFLLICCCATLLITGCCHKKRGRYKTRQRRVSTARQNTRYVMVRDTF